IALVATPALLAGVAALCGIVATERRALPAHPEAEGYVPAMCALAGTEGVTRESGSGDSPDSYCVGRRYTLDVPGFHEAARRRECFNEREHAEQALRASPAT